MPNFIDYSNPLPDLPDEDSPREQAARLLRDIRAFRARYESGELLFLDWVKARRLCVREAEVLGCTDELLSLMHGGAA
jgi:hypothetical protein